MASKRQCHIGRKIEISSQLKAPPQSGVGHLIYDAVFRQFQHLQEAIIDASSVIYMKNGGFLEEVADVIVLHAPETVMGETGFSCLPIRCLPDKFPKLSNDEKILAWARELQWPVISEDKKILKRAHHHAIHHFNALMILHFLLFKDAISVPRHAHCVHVLRQYAWYDDRVLSLADSVYKEIRKIMDERESK